MKGVTGNGALKWNSSDLTTTMDVFQYLINL